MGGSRRIPRLLVRLVSVLSIVLMPDGWADTTTLLCVKKPIPFFIPSTKIYPIGFEVLTAVVMKRSVF
jgi:hypothetical protein